MREFFRGLVGIFVAIALGGCSISGNLLNDLVSGGPDTGGVIGDRFAKDLLATQYNLQKATDVGALKPGDFALACTNDAIVDLGVGKEPGPSFEPQRAGPISEAAILYIRKQQFDQLRGTVGSGDSISMACYALLGKATMALAKFGIKNGPGLLPGGGLLTNIFSK